MHGLLFCLICFQYLLSAARYEHAWLQESVIDGSLHEGGRSQGLSASRKLARRWSLGQQRSEHLRSGLAGFHGDFLRGVERLR